MKKKVFGGEGRKKGVLRRQTMPTMWAQHSFKEVSTRRRAETDSSRNKAKKERKQFPRRSAGQLCLIEAGGIVWERVTQTWCL